MSDILVIGSLNMDLVTVTNRMPTVGETIIGKRFDQIPGGKGANQAAAMARLNGNVTMIGRVGEDLFGKALIESLKKDGVNVNFIKEDKKLSTGIATITVDGDGNNSIIVIPGANYGVDKDDIDENINLFNKSKIVLSQLEIPIDTVEYCLKIAKENGNYTILNPAPAKVLSYNLIKNIDLLTPNETELEIISGMKINNFDDVIKASKLLIDKGVKELIVTLGSEGSLYINKDIEKKFNAYKVDAVDTTAAGDSFNGGIVVSVIEGKSMDEAIDFASKVGALTVMKEGAQSSLPYRDEIDNFKE
ncbi:ribokinase [Clostridium sp. D2Q-11]|uniref:Ribokinase n=1 Tax=Anaeromonas frigoriresistens TaxID=2683708 RepID=A0A942UVK1_9FIRM|nr:ribokinase [Anaeromonas frigoriresistens]MBS4538845.1 ribokinase [Anaeromonas frigoriresistens]